MNGGPWIQRARVPAKVNLSLRVLGRRRDGFHEIETVYHTVGIFDELYLAPARRFAFTTAGLPAPRGPANLCVLAHDRLRRHVTGAPPVALRLVKRIPSGAGLGGGSADAAACLVLLATYWRVRDAGRVVRSLAARLGSDVPFFLAGGAALGRGRGERLTPLASRLKAWAVVLKPRLASSTREAYRALDRRRGRERPAPGAVGGVVRAVRTGRLARLDPRNDFEPVLATRHPKIARLRSALLDAGARTAFMTGSGSAVVGLTESRSAARAIARRLGVRMRVAAFAAPLAPLRIRLSRVYSPLQNWFIIRC